MKIIVAGSRDFDNYDLLKRKLDFALKNVPKDEIEIVSGTARGADQLGERYAKERGYKTKRFHPDWSIGKAAGYIRNEDMAKYADACVLFWDGASKGTGHMRDLAVKYNLKLRVITYGKRTDN